MGPLSQRALVGACLLLGGCASSTTADDGGRPDAGPRDSGARDAGLDARDATVVTDTGSPGPDTGVSEITDGGFPWESDGGRMWVDLVIRGEGLDSHEGRTAYVLVEDTFVGAVSIWHPVTIVDGRFALLLRDGFDRNLFGMFGYVYIDVEGDGDCTGSDPAWSLFINNRFGPAEEEVTLRPGDPGVSDLDCETLATETAP